MSKTAYPKSADSPRNIELCVAGALFFLVFLSPYYRGLYFEYEKYPFLAALNVIVLLWLLWRSYNKEWLHFGDITEWLYAGFALLYLLNLPLAADKGLAFQEFITYATCFFLFLAMRKLRIPLSLKKLFLFLFGLNGLILALLGFSYQMGWIDPQSMFLKMSFRDLFLGGRLNASFQYPNTAGAYFAMGYISVLVFILLEEKLSWRIPGFLVSFVLLGAFFFTYSRGGYLTFPLSLVFLLFVLQPPEAARLLTYNLGSAAIFLPFLPKTETLLLQKNPFFFGHLITASIAFAVFGELVTQLFQKRSVAINRKKLAILISTAVVLFVLLFVTATKSDFLPARFAQRIKDINLQTHSVVERFLFYRDALKIFSLRPLNGWGGGAWKTLYFKFQSAPYFTESTHNFYVQILVESGILGILLFLSLFVFIFKKALQSEFGKEQILQKGILGILLMGLLHSLIDVNFSLGAFQLTVWSFAGLAVPERGIAIEKTSKRKEYAHQSKMRVILTTFSVIVSAVLMVLCLIMSQSTNYAIQAEYYLNQGHWKEAALLAEKSLHFNPWNAETHFIYSNALRSRFLDEKQPFLRAKSFEEAQKAYRLAPQNHKYIQYLGFLYVEMGKFETGISYLERAVQNAPLVPATYEGLISALKSIGDFYYARGEKTKTMDYYKRAEEVLIKLYQLKEKYPQIKISNNLAELARELKKYGKQSEEGGI
ncbi:O-antigen ligase family protein [Thermatribacter velox]|uniref:O-antigen ligase family protein n=1 Tax=Thermatribacter velox TaxID=3039681 RepID=A0ABZ2YEY5_9BACT